ncbi:MAG: ATP-binding protein [Anaerolineales bacterium]
MKISLISRKDIHPAEVDTNLIAEKALKSYTSEIENYNIDLDLKDLPACQADPELLELVFHNLIGNAIKFSRNADQPEIKIGAQPAETSDKVVFFIRDNGIGFKMKDQDKVFQTFQSLHKDANSGSGVGLTIANIIIHKHGGQIWAAAEQGTGATFFFELPLPPNSRNLKPEA